MGRPNLYIQKVKPRLAEIKEWAAAGATNHEIAAALGVGKSNFCSYIKKYQELKDSLQEGRMAGIPSVKLALYRRAVGFEYEEVRKSMRKTEDGETQQYIETTKKQALPEVRAIEIYLRNYDLNFRDHDALSYEFKKMEIELKEKAAEMNF